MNRLFWILMLSLCSSLSAQDNLLVSGPMVGYAEMREAVVWVQTNGPAAVQLVYVNGTDTLKSATYLTRAEEAYTAHLLANQVRPGLTYTYEVLVNGKSVERDYAFTFKTPPLWQYRTEPPEMKIALGSCTFINEEKYDRPGRPYGGEYEIFTSLHKEQADFMLWLGDNTYLREADWYSRTGVVHRYTHTRAVAEMQPFLASTSHYAIWDDHDYGPNDSDRTYRDKHITLETFKNFWANPTYGIQDVVGGTVSFFEWGDAQFFLLDDRYSRAPNYKSTEPRRILGKEQMDWLVDALIGSRAKWKFVCVGGQMLNTVERFETFANIAPEEREYLLDQIAREGVRNVVFLTGDRHHSELSFYEKHGIKIYDFTVSPLTSGAHNAEDEANDLRVEGSHVGVRNYGIIDISGPRKDRKLRLSLRGVDGEELYTYEIPEQKFE